jgi:hypothetical protein
MSPTIDDLRPTKAKKTKELILYICKKSENDPKFGSMKLNKILFFSDLLAYRKTGKSITGQEHQNLPLGPALRCLVPIRDESIKKQELRIEARDYFGNTQHRPVALREPDMTIISLEEKTLVDEIIKAMIPFNGTEASELSHQFIGWQLTEMSETIPLGLSLLTHPVDLTEEESAYIIEMQRRAEDWLKATA